VKHSTETIATLDTNLSRLRCRCGRRVCRMRRLEIQRSMGPMTIVVCDEDSQDVLEMLLVQDQ